MIFCPVLFVLFTHCNVSKIWWACLLCSKIYVLLAKVFKFTQKGEVLSLQNYFLLSNAVSRKYSSSSVVSHLPLEIIWTICFPLLRKFFSSISPPTKARVERCWQEKIMQLYCIDKSNIMMVLLSLLRHLSSLQLSKKQFSKRSPSTKY